MKQILLPYHLELTSFLSFWSTPAIVRTPGTVVKRKRGKLLADLANPGDEVLVARGGQGGVSQFSLIKPDMSIGGQKHLCVSFYNAMSCCC